MTTPGPHITGGDPRQRLLAFVLEREAVRVRREQGDPPPWTEDPILRAYRFCNVRREDDRMTRWIASNWRDPNANDPDLWFAMLVARFVNWPDTLAQIGYPVPWRPEHFLRVMAIRSQRRQKRWTGAYIVRAESGAPGKDKATYQAESVFNPLWHARKRMRPHENDTLSSYHLLLGMNHGLGSFMAAQVVADLKWVEPLRSAADWLTFAASGPGSRRGLNRVLGRPVRSPWREDEWRLELGRVQDWLNKQLRWDQPLCGQNTQNVLCEHDKYERVRLGEGRPRSGFREEEAYGRSTT